VQMGDWMNSLIVLQENWHVTAEDFPQVHDEYFGNDYLLFPAAPHMFSHIMPQVHETYGPFFLRALQALRTEDQANAARWMGSLLHFVTDSGSPPHTIGLVGPNHSKMENWLDASKIDLRGYKPQLLGNNDSEAVEGLRKRMDGLIARNAEIGKRMVPYAQADDRTNVEPLALDCAIETAKVTADVIHTLFVLSSREVSGDKSSLVAIVTAPALVEHPLLPAKLVLLGTGFSTLSSLNYSLAQQYSGSFLLTHLPPGVYRAAIERPGAETLFTSPFTLRNGRQTLFEWRLLQASPGSNQVQNPDFALRWVSSSSPDHWHHDDKCHCWLSDNIPVTHGHLYRATIEPKMPAARTVSLEWMAQHWKRTEDASIDVSSEGTTVTAPDAAVYVRFSLAGDQPPATDLLRAAFMPLGNKTQKK
jgi:hypothetical protein